MRDLPSDLRNYVDMSAPTITIEELRAPYVAPAPPSGGRRPDARPRRHRARRLLPAIGFALLAAVLVTVARATPWDDGSRAKATVLPGTELPVLGFAGQPMVVGRFVPKESYRVFDLSPTSPSPDATIVAQLDVQAVDHSGVWGGTEAGAAGSVDIEGQDVPIEVRTASADHADLVARWQVAPGVQGELSASHRSREDAEAALRSAAARVGQRSVDDFTAAVRGGGREVSYMTPLVPPGGRGTTIKELFPTRSLTLSVADGDGSAIDLEISGPMDSAEGYAEHGEAVTVRGRRGYFFSLTNDATRQPVNGLVWHEGRGLVTLSTSRPLDRHRALELAESLREPSTEEWEALLYPEG
jgi:hypothetical protein